MLLRMASGYEVLYLAVDLWHNTISFRGGILVESVARIWSQINSWESIVDGVTIGDFYVKNNEHFR